MTAHAKKYFRPTLETLENREMMDAGIGAAVMPPMMPDIAQNAQVRLLAQQPSALQNPNNPLSQLLTQANQAFLVQSQQVKSLQAAVDHIFSAWPHHVDQVVHNIPGLQAVANYQQHKDNPTATLVHNIPGLQGLQDTIQTSAELPAKRSIPDFMDKMCRQAFDAFKETFAQGGNVWGIVDPQLVSFKVLSDTRFQLEIDLTRVPFLWGNPFHSTLTYTFSYGSVWDGQVERWSAGGIGSEVMTDGKPDASLLLLQTALLGLTFDYKG